MNLNEIRERLLKADKELLELAAVIKPMIPKDAQRGDPTWECFNCVGGAGSAVVRARRAMERAINEL